MQWVVGLLRVWIELPEFADEETAEEGFAVAEGQAGAGEDGGVVGERVGAESGDEAEGEVERGDQQPGRDGGKSGGNGEFGDEPKGVGSEAGTDGMGEREDLVGWEAVEEEVRNDEVVSTGGDQAEGIGFMDSDPVFGVESSDASVKEAEHGGALVNDVGVQGGVSGEEVDEKAAISVAENEGAAGGGELGKAEEAAMFEHGAEGEVFEPAIGASDAVEVGGRGAGWADGWHQRRKSTSRGVSRAASAAMRRWKDESRERSSARSKRAAAAAATQSAAAAGLYGRRSAAARAAARASEKLSRRRWS